jgi:iron complex transport system substrate-binding protein
VPREPQQRIVSLAPSVTSILIALGARRQLVGVSRWCPEVADVGDLPRLGDCWALEPESMAKLRPTLVIGSVPYRQETVAKLLELPLAFLAMNPRTLADIYADIFLLGRLTNRNASARRLARKMRAEFDTIRKLARRARASRAKNRPRVYCEAWPHPRISSPPWVAELVEIAGGEMVVPSGKRVTDQQVAEAHPDTIVLAWAATGAKSDPQQALDVKAWKDVPAIRDKRVFAVRDELLNTPGPPLVAGARELLGLLHPSGSPRTSHRRRDAGRPVK